ncbi:PQQ-binding-like beta-propeller repeat protein [Chitinophaga sp.]|uniref:outer membrane protein assembly factor BamB family protein n=1 Tax=Chitinophaga sp. TaxID=1869181 RepID=UPI00260721CB|nr:PQQ-binding-like beta-propeller repeat protein [uncultured Chitinophaga sp.]
MQSFILTAGLVALGLCSAAQDKTFGPIRWTFTTEGRFFNTPAITGNTLLAGNSDHKLYALDAGTGQLRWAFETGGGIATEPCVAGNVAVIGSYDGHYYAVDVRTGRERWRFKTGGERKLGGKGLWTMQPLTQYMEDPYDFFLSSPIANGRHVYFGSSDSCIYAVNIATGKLAWKFRTRGPVHGSVAFSDNTVIAGSWDTYLYALDAQTGKLKWKYKTGTDTVYHGVLEGIQSRPAIAQGKVYIGARDAKVHALNLQTGDTAWVYNGGVAWIPGDAAATAGHVYIGTSDSYLMLCLDARTGRELHQAKGGGYIFGGPAIKGNLLCYGDFTGRLQLLNRNTFQLTGRFDTKGRTSHAAALLDSAQAINFGHLAAGAPFEQYSTTISVMDKLYRLGPFTSTPIFHQNLVIAASANGLIYGIALE